MIDAIIALNVQLRAFHVLSTTLYANIASYVYSLPLQHVHVAVPVSNMFVILLLKVYQTQ
jgi:hypothetical protein